ncbi:MAG TPA: energy-coupling factor transporter transmembrane component T [Roseiflexaceae bacterium]|nr:energy-coupling factor transporter transmembrane component T [Roseiflexaceae bacterium]
MAVEFSRNITFGQYLNLGSPVHRLDPRAKTLAVGALMVAVFQAQLFIAFVPLLVVAALVLWVARIPLGYTLRGMRLLIGTTLVFVVFQILFFPNPDPASTYWRWGILSLSWQGLGLGLLTLGRVMLLYFLVSTLMFTTALMDLADGFEVMLSPLKRLRVPVNELVMTMVVALKFVPLLVAELERLIKARAARGAGTEEGGLVGRARQLSGLLVPLFVSAFARAELLIVAMNARCYRGGQGRTRRRVLSFRRADLLAMGLAALALAAVVGIESAF